MEDNAVLENLISAIINNDLNVFEELFNRSLQRWLTVKIASGNTLIYEIIRQNRKDIFDCLLPCLNLDVLQNVNDSGETVLAFTLKNSVQEYEYYAKQLISKGALDVENQADNLLHLSVRNSFLTITKLLLEWGVDPNVEDQDGKTPLCIALERSPVDQTDVLMSVLVNDMPIFRGMYPPLAMSPLELDNELISALLVYGANPFIKCTTGHIPFEMVVTKGYSSFVQTLLFDYTFDKLDSYSVHFDVLYNFSREHPSYRHKVIHSKINCIRGTLSESEAAHMFIDFFYLDLHYLKFLVEKYGSIICYISRLGIKYLTQTTTLHTCTSTSPICNNFLQEHISRPLMRSRPCTLLLKSAKFLLQDQALERLSVLTESSTTMKYLIVDFIAFLNPMGLPLYQIKDELQITHLLIYLIEHGFKCDKLMLQQIYHSYGFCDLFKFLLHIDLIDSIVISTDTPAWQTLYMIPRILHSYKPYAMYKLTYEFNTTIEQICSQPDRYEINMALMDYFAHPKLNELLMMQYDRNLLVQHYRVSEDIPEKIRNHPRVPLLQELTRNSIRKYLAQCCNVICPKDFFLIVNKLPINNVHKQILTLERKLY